MQIRIKASIILAILNGVAVALTYYATKDITLSAICLAIACGIEAGIHYEEAHP